MAQQVQVGAGPPRRPAARRAGAHTCRVSCNGAIPRDGDSASVGSIGALARRLLARIRGDGREGMERLPYESLIVED